MFEQVSSQHTSSHPSRSDHPHARDNSSPPPPSQSDVVVDMEAGQANPDLTWVTDLRTHWQNTSPSDRERALGHLQRAQTEENPEECLQEIQKGLRPLGVGQLQLVKLILTRYLDAVPSCGHPQAPKHVADQIGNVLRNFQTESISVL